MAAPTNISALLATDLGTLPFSGTQTVDDAGTTYDVWYRFTAAADGVVSVWGNGGYGASSYFPRVSMWLGPAATPVQYLGGVAANNAPLYIPVTAGVEYFIFADNLSGNPSPAVLTLDVVAHTAATSPSGSLVVPDDNSDFPLALLSASVDDTAHQYLMTSGGFPNGEDGDVLPDGTSMVTWSTVNVGSPFGAIIYDASYNPVATVFTGTKVQRVTTNLTDAFYVATQGATHFIVKRVEADGTIDPTDYDLGTSFVSGIAVNAASTILYYRTTASGLTLKRWDLVNNVALSDLVTVSPSLSIRDMLCLADGSVLVGRNSGSNAIVMRYSAAGALLDSYTTPGSSGTRLARGVDDSTSFWTWKKNDPPSSFVEIRVSDGTVLNTISQGLFSSGVWDGSVTDVADVGDGIFGSSESCPFWISRTSFGASSGTIRVVKVVVPLDQTGAFEFSAGGGLSPSTFTLSADGDMQVFNGVPVGSGYSIAETAFEGFVQMSVVVSNDSPADDITVADGETVTVTVTNSQTIAPPVEGINDPIRWVRRSPTVFSDGKRIFHRRFQVDFQPGVGLSVAEGEHDHDPIVLVRTSDNGGFTWSSFRQMTLGPQGDYDKLMKLYQLGSSYARIYEVSGDSPTKFCIVQAFIDLEGGSH